MDGLPESLDPIGWIDGKVMPENASERVKENFIFLDEIKYPSAKEMSFLSFEKYKNNDFVDLAYFEPYYLKDFMVTVSKK